MQPSRTCRSPRAFGYLKVAAIAVVADDELVASRAAVSLPTREGARSELERDGRRDLLIALERAISRGLGGVIVGEAGIGKSHAARVLAKRLRARGATVEFLLATEAASTVPFGAFAGVLEPASKAAGDLLDVLRNAGSRVAGRARGGVLVVIVDDAHLLDPASAALLLQLVTRHGVRVLATARAGAATPDAVRSLWKDAGLLRVDLGPLTEDASVEVVRHLLGGPVERETSRWLWETSAGNPLFLRELVRCGVDSAALARVQGHWRLSGTLPPSSRLLELLDARIEGLAADERRALALVVLAEPVDLELLERLGALDGARALESRGLLAAAETSGSAALRVGHPLYGEALRAGLTATETRFLHAELASELDPSAERVGLRLATWALEDGRQVDDGVFTRAAEEALAAFDTELAIRLGRAALAQSPGIDAALPLATALRGAGRFEEAETHLAAVEGEAANSARLTAYLFARATNLQWGLGRARDAEALLARIAVQPARAAVAAALHSSTGRLTDGVACARRALASPSTDQLAMAIAAIAIGRDLATLGDPLAALMIGDRGERAAKDAESEWPKTATAVFGAFYAAEQWAERRAALERRHAEAKAAGDSARAALCELAFARLAIPAGELEMTRRHAEDSLARLAFLDPRGMAPVCHAVLAATAALAGRAPAARAALQNGYEMLGDARGTPPALAFLQLVAPLVLAAEGDHAAAQRVALEGARACGEAILAEAEFLHLYMRAGGDPGRAAPRLREIAARARSGMADLWTRQAAAAHNGDGAALEAVADDFERVGARIYAAEAAAQAAVAHDNSGTRDARRRAESRAARLASACGAGGLTLVATMRMSGLTAREQQTAGLVARGLSNGEIAARLSVSVRTVESHVYRATTKLGVHDRDALVALLAAQSDG